MMKPASTFIILLFSFLLTNSCSTTDSALSTTHPQQESPAPLLNSERIRQKFGSYGIDVVKQFESIRVSDLFSLEQERKVTRTFAVVFYPSSIPSSILTQHTEIKNGHSIGAVFKRNDWDIEKQHIWFGDIAASPDYASVYSSMGAVAAVDLAVHIYQLYVSREGERHLYAKIAEVHHPDYLDKTELLEIYGQGTMASIADSETIHTTLDKVARVMRAY
jgi:hypothetical protein